MTDFPDPPSAEEVRAARAAAGITQAQAGALIYRGAHMMRRYESGASPMDPAVWELYGIKLRALIEMADERRAKRQAVLAAGPRMHVQD